MADREHTTSAASSRRLQPRLALIPETSISGIRVARELSRVVADRGKPETSAELADVTKLSRLVADRGKPETSAELADVTKLVSRCPSCYPPGAYDALKALRNVTAEQPTTTAGADANRPLRRHMPASAELKNDTALPKEPFARTPASTLPSVT